MCFNPDEMFHLADLWRAAKFFPLFEPVEERLFPFSLWMFAIILVASTWAWFFWLSFVLGQPKWTMDLWTRLTVLRVTEQERALLPSLDHTSCTSAWSLVVSGPRENQRAWPLPHCRGVTGFQQSPSKWEYGGYRGRLGSPWLKLPLFLSDFWRIQHREGISRPTPLSPVRAGREENCSRQYLRF